MNNGAFLICISTFIIVFFLKLDLAWNDVSNDINANGCFGIDGDNMYVIGRTRTFVLYPCLKPIDSVRCCFQTYGCALLGAIKTMKKGETMKNLTLSFWLALAAAGIVVIQNATPLSSQVRTDLPLPTCPPECPDQR
jgi:hypothetical protein